MTNRPRILPRLVENHSGDEPSEAVFETEPCDPTEYFRIRLDLTAQGGLSIAFTNTDNERVENYAYLSADDAERMGIALNMYAQEARARKGRS